MAYSMRLRMKKAEANQASQAYGMAGPIIATTPAFVPSRLYKIVRKN